MTNAGMKVEIVEAMTSQDFKDIMAKAVKEAVGQAMESILKDLKAEIVVLEGKVKTLEDTIEKFLFICILSVFIYTFVLVF